MKTLKQPYPCHGLKKNTERERERHDTLQNITNQNRNRQTSALNKNCISRIYTENEAETEEVERKMKRIPNTRGIGEWEANNMLMKNERASPIKKYICFDYDENNNHRERHEKVAHTTGLRDRWWKMNTKRKNWKRNMSREAYKNERIDLYVIPEPAAEKGSKAFKRVSEAKSNRLHWISFYREKKWMRTEWASECVVCVLIARDSRRECVWGEYFMCAMDRTNAVEPFIWILSSFLLSLLLFLSGCVSLSACFQHSMVKTYKYGDRDNHHICIALAVCVLSIEYKPNRCVLLWRAAFKHAYTYQFEFLLYA